MDGEPSSQGAEETGAQAMEDAAEGKGSTIGVMGGDGCLDTSLRLVGPFPSALCSGRSRSRKRTPRGRLRAGDGARAVVLHQDLSSRASPFNRNSPEAWTPERLINTRRGPHHVL